MSPARASRGLPAAALCALLGLTLALLLFLREIDAGPVWLGALCSRAASSGCAAVGRSPLARPFGVSLALIGAAYYGILLVLCAAARLHGPRGLLPALFGLAALGLVADVGLLSYSLFGLGALCPGCALTYLATLGCVGGAYAALRALERSPPEPARPRREALAFVLAGTLAVLAGTAALAERAAPHTPERYAADPDRALRLAWDAFLAHYRAQEAARIDTAGAPRKGAVEPVLELVLFADFACGHCERAARSLGEFVDRHRESVALVFEHYPLDDECNPASERVHPGACRLARAAVSAGEQRQFWRMHDLLFANRELWGGGVSAPQLESLAAEIGLDPQAFRAALDSERARTAVAADLAEAEALGVDGTPTLFVNGRRMPSIPIPTFLEELLRVVADERAGFTGSAYVERGASE